MNSQVNKELSRTLLISCFVFIFSINCSSQSSYLLDKSYENLFWNDFVEKVEQNHEVRFFYTDTLISNFKIQIPIASLSLEVALNEMLQVKHIKVSIDRSGNIFLSKEIQLKTVLPEGFFKAHIDKSEAKLAQKLDSIKEDQYLRTVEEYVAQKVIIGTRQRGLHQKTAKIHGSAKNMANGEVIIGATIMDDKSKIGVATDNNGLFEMTLSKGVHKLIVNSVNIKEQIVEVEVINTACSRQLTAKRNHIYPNGYK